MIIMKVVLLGTSYSILILLVVLNNISFLLISILKYLKRNLKVTSFEKILINFKGGRERKSVGFFEDPQ